MMTPRVRCALRRGACGREGPEGEMGKRLRGVCGVSWAPAQARGKAKAVGEAAFAAAMADIDAVKDEQARFCGCALVGRLRA